MKELQLSLDFACQGCGGPVAVTVQCRGPGLQSGRGEAVASVKIACPTCGQVNQVDFEQGGKVQAVRACYPPRPLPTPSLN